MEPILLGSFENINLFIISNKDNEITFRSTDREKNEDIKFRLPTNRKKNKINFFLIEKVIDGEKYRFFEHETLQPNFIIKLTFKKSEILDLVKQLVFPVEIRESLIDGAGRGVFAIRNFDSGEYVCFYDGIIKSSGEIKSCEENDFSLNCPDSNRILVGFRKPRDPLGVGQIINDAVRFELRSEWKRSDYCFCLSDQRIDNAIEQYMKNSLERANVVFVKGKFPRLFAKRSIHAGEELYYPYGSNYWISNIANHTDMIMERIFCLSKIKILQIKNNCVFWNECLKNPRDTLINGLRISPNGKFLQFMKINHLSDTEKIRFLINNLKKTEEELREERCIKAIDHFGKFNMLQQN